MNVRIPVKEAAARAPAAVVSPLLNGDETAAYVRRTKTWVYRMLRYEIPIVRMGKRILFEKRDLDVWIATHKEVPR
ncbi:MAG TPA: helix-turn-helix domain-containing protein [Acidimicrobiales bacterium]|nr:helix-turn-helix domain-containing protein [Acidimicrobiales bacterium]